MCHRKKASTVQLVNVHGVEVRAKVSSNKSLVVVATASSVKALAQAVWEAHEVGQRPLRERLLKRTANSEISADDADSGRLAWNFKKQAWAITVDADGLGTMETLTPTGLRPKRKAENGSLLPAADLQAERAAAHDRATALWSAADKGVWERYGVPCCRRRAGRWGRLCALRCP